MKKIVGMIFAVCVCAWGGSMSSLLARHHAIIGAMGNGGGENFVHIGEHDYSYVKIGDLYWTTENLQEDVQDSVWYNNHSPYKEQKFGKLYARSSMSYVDELLHSGWRVPYREDWNKLNLLYSALDLCLRFGEDVYPNTSKFSVIGCGYYYDNFTDINKRSIFWAKDSNYFGYDYTYVKDGLNINRWAGNDYPTISRMKLSIRLCKDA